jgi:hypothetical protein
LAEELDDVFVPDELFCPGFVSPLEIPASAPNSGLLLDSEPQAKRQKLDNAAIDRFSAKRPLAWARFMGVLLFYSMYKIILKIENVGIL